MAARHGLGGAAGGPAGQGPRARAGADPAADGAAAPARRGARLGGRTSTASRRSSTAATAPPARRSSTRPTTTCARSCARSSTRRCPRPPRPRATKRGSGASGDGYSEGHRVAAGSVRRLQELRLRGEPVRDRVPVLRAAGPQARAEDRSLLRRAGAEAAPAPEKLPRLRAEEIAGIAPDTRPYATFGLITACVVGMLLYAADPGWTWAT